MKRLSGSFVGIDMRKLAFLLAVSASTNVYAAITGTIFDTDAKPIAGATIRAYAAESSSAMRTRILAGKIEREPVASAQTAENGTFSLDVKGAVAVDVLVDAPSRAHNLISTVDGDDLGAIVLGPPPSRVLRVTSGGKPVANAIVVAGFDVSRTNAAGEVPAPFSTSAWIVHPDYAISRYSGIDGIEAKLVRGVAVRGRVVNAAGAVAHAIVSINGWPLAESADDGTFTIAHAPDKWQSISAVRGSEAGSGVRPKTATAEIRLAPAATFTGTVHETGRGGAAAGARMTMSTPDDEFNVAVTDAKGAFSFLSLLPRTYQIAGMHPTYAIDSASVTLPATRTRAFTAEAYAYAKGRVIDEDRKAIAGAIVSATGNSSRARTALTNANGEFTVRVQPGTFPTPLSASKREYVSVSTASRIWKPAEVRNDIVITLPHGFVVQVRVVDKQRQPAPNALVNVSKMGDQGMQRATGVGCADPSKPDCRRTGADGLVAVRTSEGRHDFTVTGDDIAPVRLQNQVLTSRSATIVVTVDRGIEISGRVVRPDGTPVADAMVETPTGVMPRTAETAADGTFKLVGIAAGPAVLTAHSSDGILSSPAVSVTAPAKNVTITMPLGARIEGRVIDRTTQQPVTDFTIALPPRNPHPYRYGSDGKTIHADDGHYAIDNVPPGTVDLYVRAAGYVLGSRGDVVAEDGKTVSGIDIQLDRGATISGRVTAGGTPVAGVDVRPEAQRMPQMSPMMSDPISTDADGLYKMDGVAEGERTIRFNKNGFVPAQKSVEVKGGADVHLDVELDPGHELRGRVVDRSGRGVVGAYVDAWTGGGRRNSNMNVTDGDGAFTVAGLSDGKYQVTARKEGMVSADVTDVDVPQARPLTMTLDAGATITGRVSGLPPEELTQVVVTASGGTSRNQTNADASGTFALPGLPDGQVRVEAILVTAGRRRTAPFKTIVIENGIAPAVELNFEEGITVTGRVTKGGVPLSLGNITFIPVIARPASNGPGVVGGVAGLSPSSPDSQRQYVNAMISTDGTYTAAGLAIGDYSVRVTSTGALQYQTKYTAAASGTFDVDIHGATLRGRVVDARSGAPLAGARVTLTSRLPANGAAATDSDGRFAIDTLPDATYDLSVSRDEYAVASQSVVVANGSTPDVDVRLEQTPAITIHVTDSVTGAPVDANVFIQDPTGASLRGEATRVDSGTFRAWLKAGNYTASIGARGYVFKSQSLTAPGDVAVALVRAGALLIRARTAQRARLDLPDGGPRRGLGMLRPGTNGPYESMPPGSYMLTLIGSDGKVVQSIPVLINAGQTTTIDTP
ncbi:MAG TPA: carboxypeptidase-like regulatory domain-containing protein [Thermoanaerobaculia bacterium]|nr:carboxypeptidase-like regulatory domain-containing protein [Thermoanaerobaculia bacterium]